MHRSSRIAGGIAFAAILVGSAAVAAETGAQTSAERLYNTHCVSCHGPGGNLDPDSPVVQGLGVVPANFTDPLFNSREPGEDWEMVIEHGGAALGLSNKMPAFGDVLTEHEIESLVHYLKAVPGEHDYPDGALNLFLPLNTIKAFPEDEVVFKSDYIRDDGDGAWENVYELEKRVGKRAQVLVELIQTIDDGDSDLDKVEVGGKYVLHTNARNTSITTAGARLEFPVHGGDEEFLPYLAFGRILNSAFTFQGHTRAKLPFEDFGDGSLELAGIVHWTHSPWPRNVFPGLEVVADIPFDSPPDTDFAEVSVIPQARIGLTKGGHVALNVGVQIPVNERDRYDYVAQMNLLWDFADGPFWKGW
jgi:mono/diheme cytochrome c family protein